MSSMCGSWLGTRLLVSFNASKVQQSYHCQLTNQLIFQNVSASAHITCRSPDEYMGIANKIKRFFHNEGIHSTTIQPEFVVEDKKDSECALECGKDENCAAQKCCPGENETEMRKRSPMTDGEGSLVNHESMV